MLRCLESRAAGAWPAAEASDRVVMDLDARRRRRQALTSAGGLAFLLDLPAPPGLRAGDGLRLEDGRWLAVEAAAEALVEVTIADPAELPRIAWHLGNRHLPVQFTAGGLRLRPDHVIEALLRRLGAQVRSVQAPFEPEGGAYGQGDVHRHDPDHHHSHG
jgi:urease accessory protein